MKLPTEPYQAKIHVNKNESSALTILLSVALLSNPLEIFTGAIIQ